MSPKSILICSLLSTCFTIQSSEKLVGNIIGTEQSVDYTTGMMSTTVNTKNNVFDGKFDTFFASYDRSNTWVGLDLGEKFIIKKVGYAAKADVPKRVQLGLFEGANNPDFSDALPIFIIPEATNGGKFTYSDVMCSRGFRYVRYVGPNDARCNIAELEFYGDKGEGDDSRLYQLTNLPVVIISTENAEDIVSKEISLRSTIKIISENGTKILEQPGEARGRGNSSWKLFPKKPYRIKFDSKQLVPGATTKAKKWTLISNYDDKTLMRNDVAFEMSRRMGFPFSPMSTQVDLILNGEYKGTYGLCDQIEVGKGRVNVDELAPEEVSLPELSGGYLLEVDGFGFEEPSMFYSAVKQVPVTIKSPDDDKIVPAQYQYINNFFNSFERAVLASDFSSPTTGYRKYIDMKSFVNYFLLEELAGNMDAYWSTYMYKNRGEDKLYTGPVWDFDIAFDNDTRCYPVNKYNDYLFRTGGAPAGNFRDLLNRIFIDDTTTKKEILDSWTYAREFQNITPESLCDFVEERAEHLDQSQNLNFKRWDILNTKVYNNPQAAGSYRGELDFIKKYIVERFNFLDKKIGYIYTSVDKLPVDNGTIRAGQSSIIFENFSDDTTYSIYNVSGMSIRNGNCSETVVNISIPGVYIVKVTSASTTPTCSKLIVK